MNENTQHPAERGVTLPTRFAIINTHSGDKLRLLKFTKAEIIAITKIVEGSWHKAIQDTRSLSSAHEIKLVGCPFHCQDRVSSDSTPSRVLIRNLLAFLFSQGWVLSSPTSITTRRSDGDTLIFRKEPTPPPRMQWLAIMFGGVDHLRLIGAPRDLIVAIQELLNGHCLLQNEKLESKALNSYDFKLRGCPWCPGNSAESVEVGEIILEMLETLERFGWSLYASVEHNSYEMSDDGNKLDSWYCVRRHGWVPGRPVFHR